MATPNTSNYEMQGGDVWVVGGELRLTTSGTITAAGTQASAIADLTDSTTGTANNTLTDVGGSFAQATLNNNFADLAAKVNAILAALRNVGLIDT